MPYWTYLLHCRGGAFYAGHSDDLERRLAQHKSGQVPDFTSGKLPVELVWSEAFSTRIEALEAERRIKGWSRAKKMALIRDDWNEISALAKSKGGPSTSSGRTALGQFLLIPHPAFPPLSVKSVSVEITATDWCDVLLDYKVEGEDVVIPAWQSSRREDGLWKSTCFELFLRNPGAKAYIEFNFSPSSLWAAYAFDGYRSGTRDLEMAVEPHVEYDPDRPLDLSVDLDLSNTPNVAMLASISAVVEERDGTKSYWALAHPLGDLPDFHHPDCFVLEIPAARPA